VSLRTRTALAVVLPLLAGCGRSELFGDVGGGLPGLTSSGFNVGSAGSGRSTSAGAESNGTAGTAGNESNGTAGSGGISAGQGSGLNGTTSDVGGSTSSGQRPTGNGTSAGFTSGTGGGSGASSTGRSGGTGGTGSTGTGGSGTTTGPTCDANIGQNAETACTTDSDCGCPDTCVNDPPNGMDCEPPCLALTDCPDLGYVCNGTYCQFNACGPGTGNGSFNSFCDVTGTDDGTCVPFTLNGVTVGECYEGGTSTTCCDGNPFSRTDTAANMPNICVAGSICSSETDDSGECGEVCDPSKRRSCPEGLGCAVMVGDEITGGCFAPPPTSVCPKNE